MKKLLEEFTQVKECEYKGERYCVRDNGAILRHSKKGGKKRKNDEIWTFGVQDPKNAYMHLGGERVHRIVALAFLGEPPTEQHIVDHIDTNRCNNRPENLRYLTKLENALCNEITRSKIIYHCGSIEAFLQNPSILRDMAKDDTSLAWMRQVSPQEAQNCLKNLKSLSSRPQRKDHQSSSKLGEWIYKPLNFSHKELKQDDLLAFSPNTAKQRNWITPAAFLLCPKEISTTPLQDYLKNLAKGAIFSTSEEYLKLKDTEMAKANLKHKSSFVPVIKFPQNDEIDKRESKILDFVFCEEKEQIFVVCEFTSSSIKPFSLASISFENGFFIHTNLGTYFSQEGATKQYTLAQGLEWSGGDTFDDLCC